MLRLTASGLKSDHCAIAALGSNRWWGQIACSWRNPCVLASVKEIGQLLLDSSWVGTLRVREPCANVPDGRTT